MPLILTTDECCEHISRFYKEEMEISGRRFTPHSLSPSSTEVSEWAAKSGLTLEEVFDLEEELFWSLLDNNDSSFSARYDLYSSICVF